MPLVAVAGVGLVALFAFIVLWELQQQNPNWLQPLLYRLSHPRGNFLTRVALKAVGVAVRWAADLLAYIVRRLSWAALLMAAPFASYFYGLWQLLRDATTGALAFAEEVYKALTYLRNVAIPKLVEVVVGPVRTTATQALTLAKILERNLGLVRVDLQQMLRTLPWGAPADLVGAFRNFFNAFGTLWRYVYGQLTTRVNYMFNVAVPTLLRQMTTVYDDLYRSGRDGIGGIRQRLRELERTVAGIASDPLAWLAALLGSVAGLAMLARVLEKVAPQLFCRNVTKTAKALCAADSNLFDGLFDLFAATAILLSFREYVQLMQQVTGATASGVKDLLDVG